MAKPGSEEARAMADLARMARQAADIPVVLPDAVKDMLRVQIEDRLGLRCGGCGRCIKVGFKFTAIDIVVAEGNPAADVRVLWACNREDCDFAELAMKGADYCEMIEYAWIREVSEERPQAPEQNGAPPADEAPAGTDS